MHFYQFNVGDYARDTVGISLIEDIAYRRLIDNYHLNERPMSGCSTHVARVIGMKEYAEEVGYVLGRFFKQNDAGDWVHKRIEKNLANYKATKKEKIKAGKASGKARRQKALEQTMNTCSANVELTNNHKPLTNNHKPLTIIKDKTSQRFTPPTLSEVIDYCNQRCSSVDPQRFIDHYSANGWMRGKNKIKDWKACIRTWEQNDNQNKTIKVAETYENTVARLTDRSWAK